VPITISSTIATTRLIRTPNAALLAANRHGTATGELSPDGRKPASTCVAQSVKGDEVHGRAPDLELQNLGPKTMDVPDVIPIFPLPETVLLPGEVLPLHVFEPRYRALVRDAVATHKVIGIVQVVPGFETELPGSPPVRETGCIGYIASHEELPDGRFMLWLLGLERFRILEELDPSTPYRQVRVRYEPTPESPKRLAEIRALREELRELLPGLVELDNSARDQFANHIAQVSDAQLIALACQILTLGSDRKQEVLEAGSLSDRFLMVYEDLYRHYDLNPGVEKLDPDRLN
jgi:Lon protease-like protein